jgi:monoamine oxidase
MTTSLYTRLARRFAPERFSVSRRDMMKVSLAASAGLLLSGPVHAMSRMAGNGKRIVIIGGGFSGLACAHELLAAGYDATIIEARSRVGGRVLSFNDSFSPLLPGKNVEGGGELVGSNHPTWVSYAAKFGLDFLDVTESDDEYPIVLDGKRLTAKESEALYEEMDAAFQLMNVDAAPVVEDEPWKSPNAETLDKRTTQAWIDALEVGPVAKRGLWVQFMADNGVEPVKQSYLGNLAQVKGGGLEKYWSDSEVFRCKGGNDSLAKKLAEAIGQKRIITGLAANAIESKGGAMLVTCRDGRAIECDDVVLAVPPSVWKKIEMKPALPGNLAPQMGMNVKYLSALKGRFWQEKKLAPDALTDGDISMTWEATDNQNEGEGAAMVCFSGAAAAEACRNRRPEERDAAYAKAMEAIYPGYTENRTASRFMDWPGDQWTQAGYSFPAPGQIMSMGPTLHKGIGRLHFAGEHCCYKFVGYMEGALNSGASLAKRIAARDGLLKGADKAEEKKPVPAGS